MVGLTIGMATYKDFEGVYFTLQALRLYHDLEDTELLVVDNFGCDDTQRFVEGWAQGRYIRATEAVGTAAPRDLVFREAHGEAVLCCDSHVLFVPGAIARLKAYYREHPDCPDLIQGPLLYDDLHNLSTHLDPVWREHFWGTWATDPRGEDPEGEPFEIPMQGLGIFSCRKAAWPGFNPRFRGFGGEEGYIHEKFRQAGGRCLCLPALRWVHRFSRPGGVPYPLTVDDKLRNYLIGHAELGLDPVVAIEHFGGSLTKETIAALALEALWDETPDHLAERGGRDEMGGQRPVRHPRALERPLPDGSLTLFHPGTLEFITLSPLAAFLWASSTGQDTVDALVGEVRALFPAQEEVERDVHKLVQALAVQGFITLLDPPEPAPETATPFDFFDGIFCLNLDSQVDRWQEATRRYRTLGIERRVERFSAIPTPDNPHKGCTLSWRQMVAEADRRGYEIFLGLEDDAIFLDDTLTVLGAAVAEVADQEWDLFYLGAAVWSQDFPFVEGSKVLQVCAPLTCTHAVAVHRRAYGRILADIPPDSEEVDTWLTEWLAIDQYLSGRIRDGTFRALITSPRVATQPVLLNYDDADRALANRYVIR